MGEERTDDHGAGRRIDPVGRHARSISFTRTQCAETSSTLALDRISRRHGLCGLVQSTALAVRPRAHHRGQSRTRQYRRAEQLLAELPEDQAAFALAKLSFHRGQVDAALSAMAPLQQPDAQLQLVEWLIWDGQYDKAKTHFHRLPIGDRTDYLKALWHLQQGDALAALGKTTEALEKYKIAVRLSR